MASSFPRRSTGVQNLPEKAAWMRVLGKEALAALRKGDSSCAEQAISECLRVANPGCLNVGRPECSGTENLTPRGRESECLNAGNSNGPTSETRMKTQMVRHRKPECQKPECHDGGSPNGRGGLRAALRACKSCSIPKSLALGAFLAQNWRFLHLVWECNVLPFPRSGVFLCGYQRFQAGGAGNVENRRKSGCRTSVRSRSARRRGGMALRGGAVARSVRRCGDTACAAASGCQPSYTAI